MRQSRSTGLSGDYQDRHDDLMVKLLKEPCIYAGWLFILFEPGKIPGILTLKNLPLLLTKPSVDENGYQSLNPVILTARSGGWNVKIKIIMSSWSLFGSTITVFAPAVQQSGSVVISFYTLRTTHSTCPLPASINDPAQSEKSALKRNRSSMSGRNNRANLECEISIHFDR
ncbi:hypothetical protein SUGI_1489740 [Cryptomeria japonica]|uniref:Uncharacterized protein n=1 Tax=Cryptomeria japonica TaxID=3369 RepID=A0AAD3NSD9_CRYJA|nr:hypothetical protein SUGI_1487790 [Cryptomeria japonica]GLJ59044.1 hypothetical protein SUGI_1489740 [Cryptomeria japonica]